MNKSVLSLALAASALFAFSANAANIGMAGCGLDFGGIDLIHVKDHFDVGKIGEPS